LLFHDERGFGNCRAIGVIDADGKLIGGVTYHGWQPEAGTIEMSAASTTPRWLSAIVLDAIFRYPFVTVGCQLVLMRVSARNKRLTKQLDRLALRRHEIPRLYGRNEDGVIYSMADNDWANWPFKRKS
jgi:RimJ/RimL family protein N-acetyltransferase